MSFTGTSLKASPVWVALTTATLLPACLIAFTGSRKFPHQEEYAFDKVEVH
jgi:hypothetical protein